MYCGMKKRCAQLHQSPIPGRNGQWNKKRPKNYDRKLDGGLPARILGVYGSCQTFADISRSLETSLPLWGESEEGPG